MCIRDSLYCEAVAQAATRGGQQARADRGEDLGAAVEPVAEPVLTEDEQVPAEAAAETERQADA